MIQRFPWIAGAIAFLALAGPLAAQDPAENAPVVEPPSAQEPAMEQPPVADPAAEQAIGSSRWLRRRRLRAPRRP